MSTNAADIKLIQSFIAASDFTKTATDHGFSVVSCGDGWVVLKNANGCYSVDLFDRTVTSRAQ